jgi:HlyD family secretion protein
VIARIDPERFEAQVAQVEAELEIAQSVIPVQKAYVDRARAELEAVQASRAAAKGQTTQAELALEETKRELERKRPLAARAIVSASVLEQAENGHKLAEAQVSTARAEQDGKSATVRATEAALRTAEAQLANDIAQVKEKAAALRQAEIDLDHTYIRAPVTGVVVNRNVNIGQTVAAALSAPTLFTIAEDLKHMHIDASVVEADVARFVNGQPVVFTVDAYPGLAFNGQVIQVRKAPQVVQNVVTYVVVMSAENDQLTLLPGMTANVEVVVAERAGVLKIPNAALRFRPGAGLARPSTSPQGGQPKDLSQVYALNFLGEPKPLSVRLGITDGTMTEVIAGEITAKQKVIVGIAPPRPEGFKSTKLLSW